MSIRYHIGDKLVSKDYIRKTYNSSLLKARDTFAEYLGVFIPIKPGKLDVVFTTPTGVKTSYRYREKLRSLLKNNQTITFKTTIRLQRDLSKRKLDLSDRLLTLPAHEFADNAYLIIRYEMYNASYKDKASYALYRVLRETFAEIFRSLFCEVNNLEFKPLEYKSWISKLSRKPSDPNFELFYDSAGRLSKILKGTSLKFKAAFLRALLFQEYEPIDKVKPGNSFLKEWEKAWKYADKRAPFFES